MKKLSINIELSINCVSSRNVYIEDELEDTEVSVEKEHFKITDNNLNDKVTDMQTISQQTLEYIKRMKEPIFSTVTTGFTDLDIATTGFKSGEFSIIASRPAIGKTSFILNTTLINIEKESGVVFFSYDLTSVQIMMKLISIKTGICLTNIRKGNLNDVELSTITKAMEELDTKKLFLEDDGCFNINELISIVKKLVKNKENNIKLVIVDHIQLMIGADKKNENIEFSNICRGLKNLAKETNIHVIALSQLSRKLEKRIEKRPTVYDFRKGFFITMYADNILFIYRNDVYLERDELNKEAKSKARGGTYKSAFYEKAIEEAEIIIGKNQRGLKETVKLNYHRETLKFSDKDTSIEVD